jgi:mono/diheme cytochrome c family protein
LGKLLLLALCAAAGAAAIPSAHGGDPDRGALVWTSNGCSGCHTFKRTGSSGTAGPNLDRWLIPDAHRARLSTGVLAQRRVYWGGRGMPAYGSSLSAQDLDDLVSFVTGTDFASSPGTPAPLAPLPSPPPLVTASPAAVKRWVARQRLGPLAAKGAALFATTGCLSCHTYLGSGKRRRGGPDLSAVGQSSATAAALAAYVARPFRSGNDLMPAYADLGAGALARIGVFLAASKGPR